MAINAKRHYEHRMEEMKSTPKQTEEDEVDDVLSPHISPGLSVRRRFIPMAAFAYVPTKDDIMYETAECLQRCMFHSSIPVTQAEQQSLESFRLFLKQNRLTLPPGYDDEERNVMRFVEAANRKNKDAWDQLMMHHRFTQTFPIQISQYKAWVEELNRGYAYIYKRDKAFRPLFFMNVSKLKNTKADHDTLVNMCTYVI